MPLKIFRVIYCLTFPIYGRTSVSPVNNYCQSISMLFCYQVFFIVLSRKIHENTTRFDNSYISIYIYFLYIIKFTRCAIEMRCNGELYVILISLFHSRAYFSLSIIISLSFFVIKMQFSILHPCPLIAA